MRKFEFSTEMSGLTYNQYIKPCVYAWWRGATCLYVGQSRNGINRILKHNIINDVDVVQETDRFVFYFPKENEPDDHLDFVEQKFIKQYRPIYNSAHNPMPYEERLKNGELPDVQARLHTKADLAEILFGKMSERCLVADPRNCSDAELEAFINHGEQVKIAEKILRKRGNT